MVGRKYVSTVMKIEKLKVSQLFGMACFIVSLLLIIYGSGYRPASSGAV